MPQELESTVPDWDTIENECEHIPLNCQWTTISKEENLTVTFTCLKRTFNYDLWIGLTAHPEGNSNTWKQMDITEHHPLLKSLADAFLTHDNFPEPHLNTYQLHIFGELRIVRKVVFGRKRLHIDQNLYCIPRISHRKILAHRSRSKSFLQLIDSKTKVASGDGPGDDSKLATG